MAAKPNELALSYLLALSSDIHTAVLLDEGGELLASAPELQSDPAPARELLRSALVLREQDASKTDSIELDVMLDATAVYLLVSGGVALACTASRQSLPGIVFHEMRSVLDDVVNPGAHSLREAGA